MISLLAYVNFSTCQIITFIQATFSRENSIKRHAPGKNKMDPQFAGRFSVVENKLQVNGERSFAVNF